MSKKKVLGNALFILLFLTVTVTPALFGRGANDSSSDASGSSQGILREQAAGRTLKRANGEVFPTRQIELIVPQAAGGGTDIFCRQIAAAMYKVLGQPVVVNNMVGAAGLRGIGVAIRAAPDGYTLVASNPPGEQIAWLIQNPGFEMKELTSIVSYSRDTIMMVANSDVPYNTFPEFVDAYKTGKISAIGVPGISDTGELSTRLVKSRAGLDFKETIPYNGSGGVISALLRKEIEVGFVPSNSAVTAIADGDIKPVMVLISERFPTFPNTPSFGGDYGYDSIDGTALLARCIFAPPNLPADIRQFLFEAFEEALRDPGLVSWAKERGLPLFCLNSERTKGILDASLEISKMVDLTQ